jgi:hypothetical protein
MGAYGYNYDGEGPLGLPRALTQMGYRSVLASRWRIHSSIALGAFQRDYYKYKYTHDMSSAHSLALAQRNEILRNSAGSLPCNWAAWQVYGFPVLNAEPVLPIDDTPVKHGSSIRTVLTIAAVLVIVSVTWLICKNKTAAKRNSKKA